MKEINVVILLDAHRKVQECRVVEERDRISEFFVESEGKCEINCGFCEGKMTISLFISNSTERPEIKEEVKSEPLPEIEGICVDNIDVFVNDEDSQSFTSKKKPKRAPKRQKVKSGKFSQPAICDTCGRYFSSLKNLMLHLDTHNVSELLECDFCGKKFKSKRHIRFHFYKWHIKVHDPRAKFVCYSCDPPKRYQSSSALRHHEQSHDERAKFSCPHCNRMFKCENNIKHHIYKFHTKKENQRILRCSKCSYESVVRQNFESHQWVHVPETERPFKCQFCGKGFVTKHGVKKHEKIHLGIKEHVCRSCSKAFTTSSDLKDHERIHTGDQPYECHICPLKFGDRKRYRKHMTAHESALGVPLDKTLRKFDPSFTLKDKIADK